MADVLLVSYDGSRDMPVLLVGRKNSANQEIDILRAVVGEEATEIYKKLTTEGTNNE